MTALGGPDQIRPVWEDAGSLHRHTGSQPRCSPSLNGQGTWLGVKLDACGTKTCPSPVAGQCLK